MSKYQVGDMLRWRRKTDLIGSSLPDEHHLIVQIEDTRYSTIKVETGQEDSWIITLIDYNTNFSKVS
jgi:hypothetical protein